MFQTCTLEKVKTVDTLEISGVETCSERVFNVSLSSITRRCFPPLPRHAILLLNFCSLFHGTYTKGKEYCDFETNLNRQQRKKEK